MQASSVIFNTKPVLAPVQVKSLHSDPSLPSCCSSSRLLSPRPNWAQLRRSVALRSNRHLQHRAYLLTNKAGYSHFYVHLFVELFIYLFIFKIKLVLFMQ